MVAPYVGMRVTRDDPRWVADELGKARANEMILRELQANLQNARF